MAHHPEAVANSVDNTKLPICTELVGLVADHTAAQALHDAILLGLPLPSGAQQVVVMFGRRLTAWCISSLHVWYIAGATSLTQLQVIGNVNTKLDSSISIPSFDINVKMVEVPAVR